MHKVAKNSFIIFICVLILISLVGCGDESELRFMEAVPVIESSSKSESESLVSGTESSQSKDTSQTAYSATIERQLYLPGEECMPMNISDANELHIFLSGLSFSSEGCDGLPEYSIFFDDGSQYYINITEGWIWRNKREARLTSDEIVLIDSLIQQSMK